MPPDARTPGGNAVCAAVWRALRDVGMWPDRECYETGRALVAVEGEREIRDLRRLVGERTWRKGLGALPRPVADVDVVRILGFGRLLTEYAVASLNLEAAVRERVVRLGALANLIVAIYDHYVDTLPGGHAAIPRGALRVVPHARRWPPLAWYRVAGSPQRRYMARLMRIYYRRLDELGASAPACSGVAALVHRTIVRMYDAEALTRARAVPPGKAVLRRKAALPFVVMGLPGWLAGSPNGATLLRHLRWLYQLGILLGDIDDAVDMDADRAALQPNRLDAEIRTASDPESALDRAARRIARRAEQVVLGWRARVAGCPPSHPAISRALEITVCSWFGGIGWRPLED
jgi:hypothetical protein